MLSPAWTGTTGKQAKESQSRPVPRRQKIPMQLKGCLTPQIARPKSHLVPHGCFWEVRSAAVCFKDRTLVLGTRSSPREADLFGREQLPGRGVLPTRRNELAPWLRLLPGGSEVPTSPAQRSQRGWARAQAGFLPVHTAVQVWGERTGI